MSIQAAAPTVERPILFSAPMVRAILEGRKTQTRRVVKPAPGQRRWLSDETIHKKVLTWAQSLGTRSDGHVCRGDWWTMAVGYQGDPAAGHIGSVKCPYGAPGDRLWVREAWSLEACGGPYYEITYRADRTHREIKAGSEAEDDNLTRLYDSQIGDWRPSIHMPRWASRLTLEITGLRVERLTSISAADCIAEGIEPTMRTDPPAKDRFAELWRSINGPESWEANPWVWVVEFRRLPDAG